MVSPFQYDMQVFFYIYNYYYTPEPNLASINDMTIVNYVLIFI